MKKRHQYKITIEHTATPNGESTDNGKVEFEIANHDEILGIIEKLKQRPDIDSSAAAPLGLGIKLFGGVMLEDKKNPVFSDIRPHFSDFMKKFKQGFEDKP